MDVKQVKLEKEAHSGQLEESRAYTPAFWDDVNKIIYSDVADKNLRSTGRTQYP